MAHFAQINNSGIVLNVVVVANEDILDDNGVESEAVGIEFCKSLFGEATDWVQTSYNGNFRKRFAGVGYKYDKHYDAFIPPRPYLSWVFNKDTLLWEAPIPYPAEDKRYYWDDTAGTWVEDK